MITQMLLVLRDATKTCNRHKITIFTVYVCRCCWSQTVTVTRTYTHTTPSVNSIPIRVTHNTPSHRNSGDNEWKRDGTSRKTYALWSRSLKFFHLTCSLCIWHSLDMCVHKIIRELSVRMRFEREERKIDQTSRIQIKTEKTKHWKFDKIIV